MAKRKPSELNLLLAVDKPVGITSHDVVSKVRRALGERRVVMPEPLTRLPQAS